MGDSDFNRIVSMLIWYAGGQKFGIHAESVVEILRMKEVRIFKVPKVSPGVLGIINLRGEIIPVLDFVERLNFMNGGSVITPSKSPVNRLVVVSVEGVLYGVLVEMVSEIVEVDAEKFEDVYFVGVEFSCYFEGETLQIVKFDELIA